MPISLYGMGGGMIGVFVGVGGIGSGPMNRGLLTSGSGVGVGGTGVGTLVGGT